MQRLLSTFVNVVNLAHTLPEIQVRVLTVFGLVKLRASVSQLLRWLYVFLLHKCQHHSVHNSDTEIYFVTNRRTATYPDFEF